MKNTYEVEGVKIEAVNAGRAITIYAMTQLNWLGGIVGDLTIEPGKASIKNLQTREVKIVTVTKLTNNEWNHMISRRK